MSASERNGDCRLKGDTGPNSAGVFALGFPLNRDCHDRERYVSSTSKPVKPNWVLTLELTGACAGSMRGDGRARGRGLRILDVEPIVPVESKAKLVLDRLTRVLGGASGATAVDEAFAVGFEFNPHRVEAALGPASVPAEEIAGEIRLGWFLGHVCPLGAP
jgi:hypothetical protein